ncbi:MAG: DUF1993 family protein [Alteromonadaceae bacterium]|nr:DUF1993 family protein [Alteromonadaceae bacterium]
MINLYELTVENYLRVLGATIAFMKKSELHFTEHEKDVNEIIKMRLAPDMLPFFFQINSVRHHSLHATQAFFNGEFSPPKPLPETDFAGLVRVLEDAQAELHDISAEEVNARSGKTVTFKMGSTEIPFTTENFAMSFSIPNLYFHATTTYDMLRMQGAPLGKTDFMGRLKIGAGELD